MSYHELTLHEPRDSPARRQQFLVTCFIMAVAFAYSVVTSGALLTVQATEAPFPGGNFCYKLDQRDYAASRGLGRSIEEDWQVATMGQKIPAGDNQNEDSEKTEWESAKDEKRGRKKLVESRTYHVYFDDPMVLSAIHTRWLTGVLVPDYEKDIYCDPLLAKNPEIELVAKRNKENGLKLEDMNPKDAFYQTKYELHDLPSVNSLVVRFPFTNGFVSALLFTYKVRPFN
jgi:hypothetical protein